MALETCHLCRKSYEINRKGTRAVRQSIDANGNTWHIVTSDAWVVHQCVMPESVIDPRPCSPRERELS